MPPASQKQAAALIQGRPEPERLYVFGERIACGGEKAASYLRSGFSFQEDWGRWTDGARAELTIRHGAVTGLLLVELWVARSHASSCEVCDVVLGAGWGEPKLFSLAPGAARIALVVAAAESYEPGLLEIEILVVRPKTVEEPPADARALGIGLEAFRVTHLLRREPAILPPVQEPF